MRRLENFKPSKKGFTKEKVQKELYTTGTIFKKIVKTFDKIPAIKCNYNLGINFRVCHTIIGLSLMVIFQLIPYFGLYYLNRETYFNALISKTKNMVSLAKNTLMIIPLIFSFIVSNFKFRLEEKERESVLRGLRNLSILVGVFFRGLYSFLFRELDHIYILLFPIQTSLIRVTMVFLLQNLIASFFVIWIEEYLEQYGFNTRFNFSYYQGTEIILQAYNSPVPGNLGIKNLFFAIFTLAVLIAMDRAYSEEIPLRHNMVSGVKRKIELKPSSIISNAVFAYKILKTAVVNFLDLVVNPLMYKFQESFTRRKKEDFLNIPIQFLESPFFNENYATILYLPNLTNTYTRMVLFSIALDYLIMLPLLVLCSEKYSLDLNPNFVVKKVKDSNFTLDTRSQESVLVVRAVFRRALYKTAILVSLTQIIFGMIPLYGIALPASTLVYFYGRVEGMIDTVKQKKPEELPKFLAIFKNRI